MKKIEIKKGDVQAWITNFLFSIRRNYHSLSRYWHKQSNLKR